MNRRFISNINNDNADIASSSRSDEIQSTSYADDEHPPVLEPEAKQQRFGGNGNITCSSALLDETSIFAHHAPKYHQQQQNVYRKAEEAIMDGHDLNILEDDYYIDNGILCQKEPIFDTNNAISDSQHIQPSFTGQHYPRHQQQQKLRHLQQGGPSGNIIPQSVHPMPPSSGTATVIPLESTNICCGLCGTIVRYEQLISEHLPTFHPEVLVDGVVDLEEIPYETWLNEQRQQSNGIRQIRNSGRRPSEIPSIHGRSYHQFMPHYQGIRSSRQLRRISQYRVNTSEMGIPELELALQKKMVEKMGRKVPVTLVDKLHAKCGICNTVISLNKKFEIVHLVRHFNAWHPSMHKCAGTWPNRELPDPLSAGKPLSAQDFAVIDPDPDAAENLQCVWCGMFMSNRDLGMHFHEVHPEEVEVPKCNLCLQELLINARLMERFGEDFGITMPDEHTYRSIHFKRDYKSEKILEKAIIKYLQRIVEGVDPNVVDIEDLDLDEPPEEEEDEEMAEEVNVPSSRPFQNSLMNCGRRAKPKRQFIMPVVRQAAPVNSELVQAITHSHWKCRLCGFNIYAAVISAGVIKHYKKQHPERLPEMKLELCQARLDKISDGNMVLVGDKETLMDGLCDIECQICHLTYPMIPAFNICRAIRHIKIKHPEVMPEHKGGESTRDNFPTEEEQLELEAAEREQQERKQQEQEQQQHQQEQEVEVEEEMPGTSASTSTLQNGPNIGAVSGSGICIKALHYMEAGVIYATELLDCSVIDMLQTNYNISFDRVFTIYGKEINQQIFVLATATDELDPQTVEEIVRVRDPTQNPLVVMFSRMGKQDSHQPPPIATIIPH